MNGWDWFWMGAIWNEMEASSEERQQRECAESWNRGQVAGEGGIERRIGSGHQEQIMKLNIERNPDLEKRFNVELCGSTAHSLADDPHTIYLRTEVRALEGQLSRDIQIMAAVYNTTDEVVGVGNYFLRAEDFAGREPLELVVPCSPDHDLPSKAAFLVKRGLIG